MKIWVVAFGMVASIGCGGSGGGDSSLSCDFMAGGQHECQDYEFNYSAGKTAQDAACKQAGGTVVSACTHTDSAGACESTTTSGSYKTTITTWYYAPNTASQIMTSCGSQNGATYVAP